MGSTAKQILERAIAKGLITGEQALELGRLRHARKAADGTAPAVEELAVEKGYVTEAQAKQLRTEQEGFEVSREIAGYRLIEKVGAGTMGTVYRAKQLSLDRVVAIKILSPRLARNQDYVERFLREARSVARLNHPNVISGIDVGEAAGVRYFVMEFASGQPVGHFLARGGGMDERRVAKVALQIANALAHAHEAGLVHRDVKPDNILITKDGIAKLCDLGLAKDKTDDGRRSLGTPNYISPEQAEGVDEVDIRSDLYSFGATLYHMLIGKPPFDGTVTEVMIKHLSEPPLPLRNLDPDISEEMSAIVLKLMAKDPADRFQTPKELIRALEQYRDAARKKSAKPAIEAPKSRPKPKRRRRR